MRIISGKYRGKKLACSSEKVRPTSDRVKESVFNILQFRVQGSCFLDLFSGSGAIGIEAISRGAQEVYMVDRETDVLQKNLSLVVEQPAVFKCDFLEALNVFKKTQKFFDIVFIDPPYHTEFGALAVEKIFEFGLLRKNGILVMEWDRILAHEGFIAKKYGATYLNIFKGE